LLRSGFASPGTEFLKNRSMGLILGITKSAYP
jgi:hypothetical protein